ncbi:hypothetical protein BD560DRAFT_407462 [Blakeslea trispora]|nr:hypothetical protein BD560DRAFT_407462 [Blakeslea trispora]
MNRMMANSFIVDSQTGIAFKRKTVPAPIADGRDSISDSMPDRLSFDISPEVAIQPIYRDLYKHSFSFQLGQTLSVDDSVSHYSSVAWSDSSRTSSVPLRVLSPPEDASFSEYYKYIPHNFTPAQQMKQLLIWVGLKVIREAQDEPLVNMSREELEIHTLKNNLMQSTIKAIMDDDVEISGYKRPDNSNYSQERPNPINQENEKKLIKLEQTIQLLRDEIEEWKEHTNRLYEQHAALIDQQNDAEPDDDKIEIDTFDFDQLIEELDDPVQKEFIQQFLQEQEESVLESDTLRQMTAELDLGIANIRQTLNQVDQFLSEAEVEVSQVMARLAKEQRERSRYIPIPQDKQVLGEFENTEEKRKESENKAVASILRLIARHG